MNCAIYILVCSAVARGEVLGLLNRFLMRSQMCFLMNYCNRIFFSSIPYKNSWLQCCSYVYVNKLPRALLCCLRLLPAPQIRLFMYRHIHSVHIHMSSCFIFIYACNDIPIGDRRYLLECRRLTFDCIVLYSIII